MRIISDIYSSSEIEIDHLWPIGTKKWQQQLRAYEAARSKRSLKNPPEAVSIYDMLDEDFCDISSSGEIK